MLAGCVAVEDEGGDGEGDHRNRCDGGEHRQREEQQQEQSVGDCAALDPVSFHDLSFGATDMTGTESKDPASVVNRSVGCDVWPRTVRAGGGVIRRLVVGVDGSPGAQAAVRWATDVATAAGASVAVVHAADLVERYQAHAPSEADFEERLRERAELEWCSPLRDAGVRYEIVVIPAPPVDALMRTASLRGDVIVVGRRGIGLTSVSALGSTSQQLVGTASVPVVVVTGGASA